MLLLTKAGRSKSLSPERNGMTYTKPQIVSLGKARMLIGQVNPVKPPTPLPEGGVLRNRVLPAYELDE